MSCSLSGRPVVSPNAVSKRKSIHSPSGTGRNGRRAHHRAGACRLSTEMAVGQRSGRVITVRPLLASHFRLDDIACPGASSVGILLSFFVSTTALTYRSRYVTTSMENTRPC